MKSNTILVIKPTFAEEKEEQTATHENPGENLMQAEQENQHILSPLSRWSPL